MNNFTLSQKSVPDLTTFDKLLRTLVPEFDGMMKMGNNIDIFLKVPVTPELQSQIEAVVPPQVSQLEIVKGIIAKSMTFGNGVMSEFAAENVIMGITQDGMTGTVRKACSEVINCLSTGSLYDAIIEIKAIPAECKDSKYLTNVRLTVFCNKIEDYLGIPRTEVV